MGTRCNIVLKCGDQTKYIYRHYDGYPSSVLPDIKKYAEATPRFAKSLQEARPKQGLKHCKTTQSCY